MTINNSNMTRLFLITIIIFVLCTFGLNAMAAGSVAILYESTFDNGADDCIKYTDNNGILEFAGGHKFISSVYDGNIGIGSSQTGQWSYDIFTYTFINPVNSGMVSYSFDVSRLGNESVINSLIQLNNLSGQTVVSAINIGANSNDKYIIKSYGTGTEKEYNSNVVYNVRMEIDFDARALRTYVDDEFAYEGTMSEEFKLYNIKFNFRNSAAYIDNLKIEHLIDDFKVDSVQSGNGYVDIIFNKGSQKLSGEFTIKNIITAQSCTSNATRIGRMVRFNVDNSLLVNGDAYMLIFPDGIEKHMFVINNDDGKYLVDILFEDIYGNTYRGEEKFVPELARIILTFTNNTTVTDITNITIDDVVFTKEIEGQTVILELSKCLIGDRTYKLNISTGLTKEYMIPINTSEGGICLKNIAYYKKNIDDVYSPVVNFDDINVNDMIIIKVDCVKTLAGPQKILVSSSLLDGLSLKDYDFEHVYFNAEDDVKTASLDFVITDKTNVVLKTFVWSDSCKNNPLWDVHLFN